MRQIIESLPYPLLLVEAATREVLLANEAARQHLPEGLPCYLMTHGFDSRCESRGLRCPIGEAVQKGEPVTIEHRHSHSDGSEHIHEVHGYPVRDEEGRIREVVVSSVDITQRRRAEQRLRQANDELRSERQKLEAKHVALQEVLGQFSGHRREVAENVQTNIDLVATPAIRQLSRMVPPAGRRLLETLEQTLRGLTSPFVGRLKSVSSRLSPRELEVCQLIKNGASTKETSEILHLSEHTVLKLRQRVRSKLGLSGERTNLASYLRTLG